ncbi:MAG: DUF533 domain-containing protein [Pseudomonadota bacterium]
MAGFTDILGSLIQQGMSQSSTARAGNALGADSGSLNDLLGSLGKMAGGTQQGQAAGSGGEGGALGDLFDSLGKMASDARSADATAGRDRGGSLGDLLGNLGMGGGGQQAGPGGALGDLLSNLGNNKAALGGLGALAGALLGGGKKSVGGAAGGGALAMLASLALSALKKGGQAPSRPPGALVEAQTREDELALENDAEVIVKAMINAAKADGQIDNAEIEKIVGKLDDDGLTQQEKDFFVSEANKPMDLDGVISSAAGRPDLAAQLYAASLLAIETDTTAEQRYMQQLASGLGLQPQVTSHIERTLGV